eukprot:gnl/Chilomastix_caulleri/2611.p2 GENE.gnl/Chilomastix_caulleri/2611~~gnl/Chilomastix_caulleri/2611.p2  ORF type:complete len:54 (-),score=6.08 gnl/Chilomastix_caulleri/2611:63-224(-)
MASLFLLFSLLLLIDVCQSTQGFECPESTRETLVGIYNSDGWPKLGRQQLVER